MTRSDAFARNALAFNRSQRLAGLRFARPVTVGVPAKDGEPRWRKEASPVLTAAVVPRLGEPAIPPESKKEDPAVLAEASLALPQCGRA
jgi:hypothetical protein